MAPTHLGHIFILVKLYAPQSRFLFFEYSRNIPLNIPYSKFSHIFFVLPYFWNIPGIFHIPKFWEFLLFSIFYGIFHIPKFWDFLLFSIFYGIFHILETILKMAFYRVIYDFRKYSIFQKNQNFCCFAIFLEYSWNIPYSKKIDIFAVFSGFQKNKYFCCFVIFLEYSIFFVFIFHGIFRFHGALHIPKKSKSIAVFWGRKV